MAYSIRLIKVIKPIAGEWSYAHDLTSDNSAERPLYLLVNIKNKILLEENSVLDLNELGIKIITEIKNLFFESTQRDLNALKSSVGSAYDNNIKSDLIIAISAAYLSESEIVLSAVGGGCISLLRGNSLVKLLISNTSVIYATGAVTNQDKLIMSTTDLFEKYDEQRLKKLLTTDNEGTLLRNFGLQGRLFLGGKECVLGVLKVFEKKASRTDIYVNTDTDDRGGGFSKKEKLFSLLRSIKSIKPRLEKSEFDIKRGKIYTAFGVGFIVLLLFLIAVGARRKTIQTERSSYSEELAQAKYKFDEAVRLFPIDKNLARSNFLESETLLGQFESKKDKDEEVQTLIDNINAKEGEILGIYKVDPQLYLDLRLIVDGFTGSRITISAETAFVLDSINKNIIKVTLPEKRSEIVKNVDKNKKILDIASYMDNTFIFSDNEVYGFKDNQKYVIDKENNYSNIISYAYGGNLYVFEKDSDSIWRYSVGDNGYTPRKLWLSETNTVGLGNLIDVAIDGSIWILKNNSEIYVLGSGSQTRFKINDELSKSKSIEMFYTDENSENVYLLSKSNGSIIIFSKEGDYISQYVSDKIKDTTDFVVSDSLKKIYLLTNHEIYFIDLRQ